MAPACRRFGNGSGWVAALAKSDPVIRLLRTSPGVEVIVTLTFRSAVDDPGRFWGIRDFGAWAGLSPRRCQSGKTDIAGRITKAGDPQVRVMLFEAAARIPGRARVMSLFGGLGTEDRETDILEEGDRRPEPQARHDPASDVEVRHRVLGCVPSSDRSMGLLSGSSSPLTKPA